jgi:uncharacterized protein YegL
MKKGLTLLVFVMDRSGSMSDIIEDSIGGFNSLIEKQKEDCAKEGNTARVTLTIFDEVYETLYSYVDINDVKALTNKEFYARGTTSLIDASCTTIKSVGGVLSNLSEEERPEKVLFTIITDGLENTSKEYKKEDLIEMVKLQEGTYAWLFNFIGANIDAFGTGTGYGIGSTGIHGLAGTSGVASYRVTKRGVKAMYSALSNFTVNARNTSNFNSITSLNKEIENEEEKEA